MGAAAEKVIVETMVVRAPIERVFALSTRVELVQQTLGMRPFGGVVSGHIVAGARVAWRGWKFGLPTEHHTLITRFEAPRLVEFPSGVAKAAFFEDTQERGRFASFHHDHFFREEALEGAAQTFLRDEIHYALPFGWFGAIVARAVMAPHIRRLAKRRFALIAALAEGEGWREWVDSRRG